MHRCEKGISGIPSVLNTNKVDNYYLEANTIRSIERPQCCARKACRCEEDVQAFLDENHKPDDGASFVVKPQTGAGFGGVTFFFRLSPSRLGSPPQDSCGRAQDTPPKQVPSLHSCRCTASRVLEGKQPSTLSIPWLRTASPRLLLPCGSTTSIPTMALPLSASARNSKSFRIPTARRSSNIPKRC